MIGYSHVGRDVDGWCGTASSAHFPMRKSRQRDYDPPFTKHVHAAIGLIDVSCVNKTPTRLTCFSNSKSTSTVTDRRGFENSDCISEGGTVVGFVLRVA